MLLKTLALTLALALLSGCATTNALYQITPDGKTISYSSNKEQQGLVLELDEKDGKITSVKIAVDKASTPEMAVLLKLTEVLQRLLPLIEKAAMAGS